MSHNVFANNMEVSCKASSGKTICNFPDVCFTPPLTPATPPGVPIPYPNTGMASDTTDGSTSVKMANKEVMLKNKSNFSKSSGDEAGSAPKKGVVTSNNRGKVYFNAWSMDVKVEGENVPRNLDITTNNHMSKMPGNTPPMPHVSSMGMGSPPPKCEACAAAARAGNPVNPIRGTKLLDGADDLDFVLEGPLDLAWQRTYMSGLARAGFFGQGWITPVEAHLVIGRDRVLLIDREGRTIPFPAMAVADEYFHGQEMCTLAHPSPDTYRLLQADGLALTFTVAGGATERARQALLSRMSDPNDNTIELSWTPEGTLKRVTGSGDHDLLLEWTDDRLTRIVRIPRRADTAGLTDGACTVAQYDYADGDLVAVAIRGGRRTREFEWKNHIMVRHAQPGALECFYEWTQLAPEGKVLRSWTNTGTELRFDYQGLRTVVTDQDGSTQTFIADRDGHWVGYVDADGGHSRRVLDEHGHLIGTVTPTGAATRTELDDRGLPVSDWDEAGALTRTEWHPTLSLPTAVTDPLGRTERFSYDERGNLLKEVLADGATTAYECDARGQVVNLTDPLGKRKSLEYDAAGRVTRMTDCTGSSEQFEYDAHGQPVLWTDALGRETRYTYSQQGDLVAVTTPDGATVRYGYDLLGRMVSYETAMGGRTTLQLRPDGLLQARTEPDGRVTRYKRDRAGRLLQIENPNGAAYSLRYDRMGRIVDMLTFEGVRHSLRYGEDGLLESFELNGRSGERVGTTYTHDPAGRLTRVATSDGEWSEYDYDEAGQLVAGRNRHAIVSIQYDDAGRAVREAVRLLDALPPSARAARGRSAYGFEYAYDANGNVIHTRIPGTAKLAFLRYGSGHLHQILVDGTPYCDVERNAEHLTCALAQGATRAELRRDGSSRVLGFQLGHVAVEGAAAASAPTIACAYAYDRNGDLTEVQRAAPWAREQQRFKYDAGRRVVQQAGTPAPGSLHWDDASNLVTIPGDKALDNLPRACGSARRRYDGLGRLCEANGPYDDVQFEWNGLHQLVGARSQRSGLEQYAYDAFGRRIVKIAHGRTKTFLWEGERLLMEQDDGGRRVFVYHDDTHVPVGFILAPGHSVNGDEDSPESAHRFLYLHNEPSGAPFAMTDEVGAVLWHGASDALAAAADRAADVVENMTIGGSIDPGFQPLRLQGQYFDEVTGLCYNRFRYFDASFGRFISPDPIGLLGGENTYQYAPNIFSWIDPLGLDITQYSVDGARRERAATKNAKIASPGAQIQRECLLRDCTTGKRVKDDDPTNPRSTGKARRLDIVVINNGRVTRVLEVTSQTASKTAQLAKERRIRALGGRCIKDRATGKLLRVPRISNVQRLP